MENICNIREQADSEPSGQLYAKRQKFTIFLLSEFAE